MNLESLLENIQNIFFFKSVLIASHYFESIVAHISESFMFVFCILLPSHCLTLWPLVFKHQSYNSSVRSLNLSCCLMFCFDFAHVVPSLHQVLPF